jgi:cytochrome c2
MRRTTTAAALAALTLTLAACGGESEGDGINMRPGSDCLSCHTGGEPGQFAAAGTVFRNGAGAEGVTVTVTINGAVRTATTSRAGNFAFGGSGTVSAATVAGTAMPGGSGITGHCNGCHGVSTGALTAP